MAGLGRSFGMTVKVFDMYIDASAVRNSGVTVADSVEDLYVDADVVSVHIPDNASTHGSINSKLLLSMKPDGVLVNTARAGVVNEDQDAFRVFNIGTPFLHHIRPVGKHTCRYRWVVTQIARVGYIRSIQGRG